MSVLGRVLFYPTLAFNVAMEKVSSRQWYNRVDDTAILGALPFRSMTKKLIDEEDVRGVITMNEDYETKYFVNNSEEWKAAGVAQLCLETPDFTGAPTLEQLEKGVDFLEIHRVIGNSVYVHCKAGRTRSATVVAAYLMRIHGWSAENAVECLREKRPHIVIRNAQWNILHQYQQHLSQSS
ncbi:hypothetical protein CAPTEDRAFT_171084 [Capitella teleta]|uniref:Phosphatidylglycerophosphatase and protein-tyrosine phosphatase 1 n=1 Tax=Capitella teleta TaxID=283909 RepID=R7TNT3_CAPTE|nr:hypothetical protein CAPTEDRAFT_171084 [Capitella teleta]|eukprot:ELT92720.1 hypothetical protein CAPTEDRAFT_171084 [Capitella teleta]